MTTRLKVDLCVIGMDPAGYDLALAAAQLGAKVVLVTHRQRSGQVLLANGRFFARLPTDLATPDALRAAMRKLAADADKERSIHRPPALGIEVIDAPARFLSQRLLEAGGKTIDARRYLLATGHASALFPLDDPEVGLNPFLAGEDLPRALRLVGHDGEAVAIAQRLALAGIPIELDTGRAGLLPGHDAEAVAILATRLTRDGVTLRSADGGMSPSALTTIDLTRIPAYSGVVEPGKAGIALINGLPACDDRLRTTNKRVFAIGAQTQTQEEAKAGFVVDGASQISWLVARLLLPAFGAFRPPPAMRYLPTVPAIIALGEAGAATDNAARVSTASRHRIHREPIPSIAGTPGFIKARVDAKGHVLGVVMIGENAVALAGAWAGIVARRAPLDALAGLPAFPGEAADATRMVAIQPGLKRLQSPRLQGLVRFFVKFR